MKFLATEVLVEHLGITVVKMSENTSLCTENIENRTPEDLTAVILAGGLGMRLRAVVQDRPKVMANVAGRPFLTYVLDQIVSAGIKRAVVCTGFLASSISTVLNDDYQGLQLLYSHETIPLGTAGALRQALSMIQTFPVLLFNGDSYVNVNLEEFVQFHRSSQSKMSLVLARKSSSDAFGLVEIEECGAVKRFSEKVATGKSEWVNAGIYILEKQVLESIPESRAVSLEREILPKWVGQGLHGFAQQEKLFDIGTPSSLSEAQCFFEEKASRYLTYS